MNKTALITGIAGQDGSYLSEYLLTLGYNVYGIIRRNSIPEHQNSRIEQLTSKGKIICFYGDLLDISSLEKVMREVMPDEIYNLAAQSHVRISFDIPQLTVQTNALGVLNLLEVYHSICPNAKFYQASSSEMFGNTIDDDNFQRETTQMNPVSPYGCSKLFAFNICKNYRKSYKLHISNGILFNHESPRRASNFVTSKVIKAAVRIKLGLQKELILGNMDSYRDWGHAKDYVRAMHMILNNDKTLDIVVATGHTHTVRDMCKIVFEKLDLDYKKYVKQDEKYMRPQELKYLKGDSSIIRNTLGWKPIYDFNMLLDEMVKHWLLIYQK